ncbi:MAG: thiol reductant ABC exporter subunit CydD [Actinomycetaceae bacterium]|nr:thiol reductant ABC exporter subunit CydD [Actinomycetaceae bacterium]
MKPLDPRLLAYARSARGYIAFISVTGVISALLVVAQAITIAMAISPVITRRAQLEEITPTLVVLALIIGLRLIIIYLNKAFAHRAAQNAIKELRGAVIDKAHALGPRWRSTHGHDTATLVTRGLDDLGPYFISYLPQLVLSMTVTPLTILTMFYLDWVSAIFAAVTIPLIPIFMILVGKLTQEYSRQKLATMERLGSQLLDLVAGLPTLAALGREKSPAQHVHRLGRLHAHTTMQTLRVAFLSGAILEFLATLSVALVAVEVGLRLVAAHIELMPALATIMLAPEVYLPLREVGKNFHASADGVAAAEAAFEVLETPVEPHGTQPAPDLAHTTVEFDSVGVAARGAWSPGNLSARLTPGKIWALSGPSGVGKTTAVMCLLGVLEPTRGTIKLLGEDGEETNLNDVDLDSWHRQLTWVPQNPAITPGTILQNVAAGRNLPPAELQAAAKLTGLDQIVNQLPQKWDTALGHGGIGLSVGQRQRLALTRALVSTSKWIILDEPSAHLDAVSETQIVRVISQLKQQGRTVIVIAHRQAVTQLADGVIEVTTTAATAEEMEKWPQLAANTSADLQISATPQLLEGEPQ